MKKSKTRKRYGVSKTKKVKNKTNRKNTNKRNKRNKRKSKKSSKSRSYSKKQNGGVSHRGPADSGNPLLDAFATHWWNSGKMVWWSDNQSGYYFSNLRNNYFSQTHVHVYGTSRTDFYPCYFYCSNKVNNSHVGQQNMYMENISDAYQKISQLCGQLGAQAQSYYG